MIIDTMLAIILVVISTALLVQLVGPLFILKTHKLPAKIEFEPIDEDKFLSTRSELFLTLDKEIKSIGFEHIESSSMPEAHSKMYFSMYSLEKEKITASLITIKDAAKEQTYVEFSQLYSDGTMLDVSNINIAPIYPKMAIKISVKYPKINRPKDLYEVMKKIKSYVKNITPPIPCDKSNGLDSMTKFFAMESDELVHSGYCHKEIDSNGMRTLTLKGAYLMTWRSIFPGNIIQKAITSGFSKRLLKEAEA